MVDSIRVITPATCTAVVDVKIESRVGENQLQPVVILGQCCFLLVMAMSHVWHSRAVCATDYGVLSGYVACWGTVHIVKCCIYIFIKLSC